MKNILIITLILISALSHSQGNNRNKEIMAIIDNQDSIARDVFLDSTTILNMRLAHSVNGRQVWNDIDDSIKSIQQFYDIRIKFDSNEAAKNFHKKYLPENSENGPEIKRHKIKVAGVDNIKVFTQSKKISKMFLEPYGFQALCFLFVVDNYFVKFYVTCLTEYKPKYFEQFIIEARDKIIVSNSKK